MDGSRARLREALRESRVPARTVSEVQTMLAEAARLRRIGAHAAARAVLAAAHERSRNLLVCHARVHGALARLEWRAGERGTALRELERGALAPVSSGLRRLAGRRPEAPVDEGLRAAAQAAARTLWP